MNPYLNIILWFLAGLLVVGQITGAFDMGMEGFFISVGTIALISYLLYKDGDL